MLKTRKRKSINMHKKALHKKMKISVNINYKMSSLLLPEGEGLGVHVLVSYGGRINERFDLI